MTITHWANPATGETITALLKSHNLSIGGAPAAAVADYTVALGPVTLDMAHDAPLPPTNCRQRLADEGKPYPRSVCAVCGPFSPEWRECDALLNRAKAP